MEDTYISEQWQELKEKLKQRELVIEDVGISNEIILAMSACYYEGTSVGERNGKISALEEIKEYIGTYEDASLLNIR